MAKDSFVKLVYASLICLMLTIFTVSFLFGYYIHKSYESPVEQSVSSILDGQFGDNANNIEVN